MNSTNISNSPDYWEPAIKLNTDHIIGFIIIAIPFTLCNLATLIKFVKTCSKNCSNLYETLKNSHTLQHATSTHDFSTRLQHATSAHDSLHDFFLNWAKFEHPLQHTTSKMIKSTEKLKTREFDKILEFFC